VGGVHSTSAEPLVIVGAGPVGLAAAIAVRAYGLPVTVLETRSEEHPRIGSRAIFIHHDSLQLMESWYPGLGRRIASRGLTWQTRRTTWRGQDVFVRTYPGAAPDRLPPMSSLAQSLTEEVLTDACCELDVKFVWDCEVSDVTVAGDHVVLKDTRARTWKARQVIAADGPGSRVRELLGIGLDGLVNQTRFVVVDATEDPEDPRKQERVFHFAHPAFGGRNVLMVPFAGGWRVDFQCLDSDDLATYCAGPGLREWIATALGPAYAERITWCSTYSFGNLVADRMVDSSGRVLLVGDAAHLFAPFGARGMNSGFFDADAAARAVMQAQRSADAASWPTTMHEFARQRREAALRNQRATVAALNHILPGPSVASLGRVAAAALARWGLSAGAWLDRSVYGPPTKRGTPTY
jgi:3-(3-hydroxy-phenyl)propionate hydroxylase